MRRRIDTSEFPSADVTDRPYVYLAVVDGAICHNEPPPVLRDEHLWEELQLAYRNLAAAERAVFEALQEEPYDATELEIGLQMVDMMAGDSYDADKFRELENQLRKHAETA